MNTVVKLITLNNIINTNSKGEEYIVKNNLRLITYIPKSSILEVTQLYRHNGKTPYKNRCLLRTTNGEMIVIMKLDKAKELLNPVKVYGFKKT